MTLRNFSQLSDRLPAADDLLHWVGLQQQRTASDVSFAMLGALALGMLVGSAVALLFAPRAGHQLRGELGHRLGGATQRVGERLGEARERVKGTFTHGPAGRQGGAAA
jgi:hypothetical protein